MLNRMLLRDLAERKLLLLAIASIITTGVMSFVAMQSAYRNLDAAKTDYYRRCRMADFWVDLKRAPAADAERLAQLPGVAEVRSRIQFSATVDLPGVDEPINALVVSMPAKRRSVLNGLLITRGSYFSGSEPREVLVNQSFARAHQIHVGDTIRLILNNRRQQLRVVGTAISSEFAYLVGPGAVMPDPKRFGVFYVPRGFAEEATDLQGAINQVIGRYVSDPPSPRDYLLRSIEGQLADYGVLAATQRADQASNLFLSSEIDGLGAFASVMPMIFLIVAALVLNVLLGRIARQQRTTIGTLKAIGYTDARIFIHFLMYGLVVGATGGLAGGLLGHLCSAGMMIVYRQYFEFPELPSRLHVQVLIGGVAISLAFAAAGSLQAAWRMLRLRPAEAMRPEPPRQGGAVWMERLTILWRHLSAGWRMVLRSLLRNRVRTATGVFSAAMGAGLLVCGFMMLQSQSFLIDFQFYRVSRSDVDLVFTQTRSIDAIREVRRMPGVDRAEPLLRVAGEYRHGRRRKKAALEGVTASARLTVPRDMAGEPIAVPPTGVVLTRRLAELLDIRAGQHLLFTPAQGDKRPTRIRVARVADSYMGVASYAELGYLSGLIGEPLAVTGAQLKLDGDLSRRRALYRQLKRTPAVQSILGRREMIDGLMKTILESQWIFLVFLVGFAGVIYFGSIVNASIVNLAERQREVATMIALGYSRLHVGLMFLRESLLTNLAGALVGMPLGYGLTCLMTQLYDNDLIRLPVVTAGWIWIVTLALALVFTLLSHLVVHRFIAQLDVLESLKITE